METSDQEIKKDAGKNRLDLIPIECIAALGKVLTMGAEKYHDNSWREGINYSRVYAAAQRHLQAFWGEDSDVDEESKLPHLFHALCNISFLITYEENKERYRTFDDRVGGQTVAEFPDLTKMSHPEACKYLKPGMRVKILWRTKSPKRGWAAGWVKQMDEYVGKIMTIACVQPNQNWGVSFVGDDMKWHFPAFVLEIVNRGK